MPCGINSSGLLCSRSMRLIVCMPALAYVPQQHIALLTCPLGQCVRLLPVCLLTTAVLDDTYFAHTLALSIST